MGTKCFGFSHVVKKHRLKDSFDGTSTTPS